MKVNLNTTNFFVRLAGKGARSGKSHLVSIPLIVVLLASSVVAGTITGTVNGPDGQPLTGVSINVNVVSGDPCGQYFGVNGAGINTVNGTYIISNIPAGTYFLNTWNTNTGYYTDEWWDGSLSSPDCRSAQTITISAEETLADRNFQLAVGGAISGTIYQSDGITAITGQSEMGANVWIGDDPCHAQHFKGAGINPDDGTFILTGLAPGNYYMQTWVNGPVYSNEFWASSASTRNCSEAQLITVVAGQTETGKNFQLDPGAKISGHVTGNDGETVCISAHALINGGTCDLSQWAGGTNLATNGDFSFVVPAGTYFIYFNTVCGSNPNDLLPEYWTADNAGTTDCAQAGSFTVAAGEETTKNITLDQQGAFISGTVTDPDQNPIEGLVVQARNPGCDWSFGYGATTDATGKYSILVPGGTEYMVQTCRNCGDSSSGLWIDELWDGLDGTQDCHEAGVITSDVQNPQTVNFQLDPGAKISGHVAGNYGDNVCVDVYSAVDGDTCDFDHGVGGTGIDNDGNYSIIVPSGSFFMRFRPDCGNNPNSLLPEHWTTDSSGTTDCHQASTFSLALGEETTKNITLDQQGGKITGTVYDSNGTVDGEQANTGISVFSGDACENPEHILGERLASDGTFSITVPVDGEYLLSTNSDSPYYIMKWFAGFDTSGNPLSSENCQDAVKLSFPEGTTLIENVDFTLGIGGAIAGTLYQSDGMTPITGESNIGANVWTGNDPCNAEHVQGAGVNPDNGTFILSGLAPGNYFLRMFSNGSNYIEEYWADPASATDCAQSQPITVVAGQTETGKDFQLEVGGKISGFIYEEDGTTPLTGESSNVRVDAFSGTPCNFRYVGGGNVNSADGSYLTSGLPPGNVYIRINNTTAHPDGWWTVSGITEECEEASPITITSGVTTSGKNFSLPKDSDGDGLSDTDEDTKYHTDKTKSDTDGDGIPDDGEVFLWGDAYNGDIDGDGVWNIAETDADNDGTTDLREFARGTDLKDPASTPPPLTLYDDFTSGTLDAAKWVPEEYQLATRDGALHLFVDSSAAYRRSAETQAAASQNSKTTFTVDEFARNDGGAVYFTLYGVYYHENSDPGPQTGRVYASMSVGDSGSGLQASYYIGRIIDETGQMAAVKSGSVSTAALAIGTPYKMEIRYNGTNGFTFNVLNSAGEVLGTATDTGNALGAPLTDRRGLQVSALDGGGRIGVSVDTFETGNGTEAYSEYDGFESPLDDSRWATPEIAKKVGDDGKLHLLSHSYGDQLSTRSYLKHRFNYIESKVKIDSRSFQTGASRGRARLDGMLYNDSRGPNSPLPYNGNEGNVYGQVVIEYTASRGLWATVWVERVNDRDWTSSEQLISDELDIPLAFDTEYILYLGFAGDFLVAGIDSADGTHHAMDATEIETPKYLPFNPSMELLARQVGNGGEGMMSAYFDDVRVSGEFLEKPGDLNVDGFVDLTDVILGLQTMAGSDNGKAWSAGDINGDGVVGMPEVLNAIKQVSGN